MLLKPGTLLRKFNGKSKTYIISLMESLNLRISIHLWYRELTTKVLYTGLFLFYFIVYFSFGFNKQGPVHGPSPPRFLSRQIVPSVLESSSCPTEQYRRIQLV